MTINELLISKRLTINNQKSKKLNSQFYINPKR